MKRLVFVVLMLSLCAQAKEFGEASWPKFRSPPPQWLAYPDVVIDVAWTPKESSTPFVYGGVCHLFYSDRSEREMQVARRQIDACVAQGVYQKIPITSPVPLPNTRRLRIYRFEDSDMQNKWSSMFDSSEQPPIAWGFYVEANDGSCVLVLSRSGLADGHEIKHCFVGDFHRSH